MREAVSTLGLLAAAVFYSSSTSVEGAEIEKNQNEAALLERLLQTYDSRSRPVRNVSTTIFLDLSMYLVQILKLVSSKQLTLTPSLMTLGGIFQSEKEQVLLSNVWLLLVRINL